MLSCVLWDAGRTGLEKRLSGERMPCLCALTARAFNPVEAEGQITLLLRKFPQRCPRHHQHL